MAEESNKNTATRARGRPRGWADNLEQNRIKSLDRAMEVLETLGRRGGSTLSDLAEACGQPASSVYRVLVTLEARGIVDFDPGPQLWEIGAGAFQIGSHFLRRTSLVERARPALRSLMEQTGETANLGIARDGQVLFMSQVESHANIRAFFPPGTLSPMHSSGIGKALLAQMTDEQVQNVVSAHGLERFTRFTLANPATLVADLALTRSRGYALDNEEKNLGMRCVAAPIFDMHGEAVAGLSISGPSARLPDDQLPELGRYVAAAAREVTEGIGGQPRAAPQDPA
ncbi:HTH-type transcriptional regulator BhcR [Thalassococcus lentus]|uniref:IclR family transcriptional regulator n=1 Tax=Thalassococcus lentus TaxID=1210524 RepID=A0ABT4XXW4_9RHOB|nr:HTH-type transcriptional regulator BhcR [Thalassococcus lentus]MDA7426794.1 IclR family transcriptional regulator [Thalassococcus lentus]